MIEIWTEDSSAGYVFLNEINKVKYNNQLKVVPHNSVGYTLPDAKIKKGGVLYHLKNHTTNNLVLLYIDKAIDIQGTAENYAKIINEMRRHENVKIIEQVCFELGILSYEHLFEITGNTNLKLKQIAKEFTYFGNNLAYFRPIYFSEQLNNYIRTTCGRKTQYEHVAKNLLSEITNVKTSYGNKNYFYSIISGNKVGPCWRNNCCIIPIKYSACKVCRIPESSLKQKIEDLYKYSLIKNSLQQIDQILEEYLKNTYKADINTDLKYKMLYEKRFENNKEIYKHVGEFMETNTYWNYQRLYKAF